MSNELQPHDQYIDGQIIQLAGPDSTTITYQYDLQQRTFYHREGLVVSGKHGQTHVSTDPVPAASCSVPGLMSANDKCKLDSIVGTRLGVLGFQGAGMPDDGGYMCGDILLSAGSEFISLERVGNVIRFVVDVPTPFTCAAEQCFQVYWIQDETEPSAIRPPSCAGRLPGVDAYGELKIYLFPESAIINPNSTQTNLGSKGNYPSLIFKRYNSGLTTNSGQLDLTLVRNENLAAIVGWTFSPGTTGTAECAWFVGVDSNGDRMDFKLSPQTQSGLLGAILYQGSSITNQMAIITGYETNVLATNRYKAKMWSLAKMQVIGSEFTITNLRQWDTTLNTKVLDSSLDSILSVGQTVNVWVIQYGTNTCYYCNANPLLNINGLWATIGAAEFGDTITSRPENDTNPTTSVNSINDATLLDTKQWGLTNADDPLYMYIDDTEVLPATGQANYSASIVATPGVGTVPDRRYLEISDDSNIDNIQRPVMLWHRTSARNALLEIHLARPIAASSGLIYPPIDVLLRAPVSTVDTKYATVIDRGVFTGGRFDTYNWIKITGVDWHDLPLHGAVKVLVYNGSYTYGQVMTYSAKLIGALAGSNSDAGDGIYLVSLDPTPAVGTAIEILHEEYTTPAARLQFTYGTNGHDIEMQPIVGTLDMSTPYALGSVGSGSGESGSVGTTDDYIKDFAAHADGSLYWQNGSAETSATGITVSTGGFYILTGGVYSSTDYYNVLRVMTIEDKVWMWWNNLLLPSSTTPYFTITDSVRYGKFGVRLWPGAKLRRVIMRNKLFGFSEFSLGQIELV